MNHNEHGLPILTTELLDLIFFHCHPFQPPYDGTDEELKDFLQVLNVLSNYNYHYRQDEFETVYTLMDAVIGPFQTNSEGPLFYCATGLAIRELYGMRASTFQAVLQKATKSKLW